MDAVTNHDEKEDAETIKRLHEKYEGMRTSGSSEYIDMAHSVLRVWSFLGTRLTEDSIKSLQRQVLTVTCRDHAHNRWQQ